MSFITSLPHIWGPQKVLLEDCLYVGQVGVITDQVGQVEALDHAEVDLHVTQITHVTHLKIARILWLKLMEPLIIQFALVLEVILFLSLLN